MLSNFKTYAAVAGSAALLATGMGTAARADDAPKLAYTLSVIGVSDYIFRGISFTDEKPAFQPYLELTYGIGYVGFWASNINNAGIYGPYEVDVYAGIRPVLGPVNFDLGVLYYQYAARTNNHGLPGGANASSSDLAYIEFKAAGTITPVTNLTLGLTLYATPDQDFAVPATFTVEGAANYTLPSFKVSGADWVPTVGGSVGYTTSDTTSFYPTGGFLGQKSYTYWNVGLKLAVDKYFMDFRYWDTSIPANANNGFNNDLADSRFLFSAGVNLP